MSIKNWFVAVGFCFFTSITGYAQGTAISKVDAEKEALKVYPGKVKEVEEEKHKGEPAFSVEIDGKDGVHEILVRVSDGKIIQNKLEKDDDENED